jgi:hypothetical protein
MKKAENINVAQKPNLRLGAVISRLTSVEQLCKQEAEKNPVGIDLFQSGKQHAYSHIYFEMKPILEKANWIAGDRWFYKVAIGGIAFCLGFLACMWMFGLINGL